MTEWYCTFHYPPNWIEVVHRPGGRAPVGSNGPSPTDRVHDAMEISFASTPPDRRRQLADRISAWMEQDARLDAAVSAHGYDEPAPGAARHMHMTMWVTERSLPDSVDDELRLLSDTVREAGANVEPPQVSDVLLPAGRALRIRQRDHAVDPDGTTASVDTVDYWVPVGASNDLLWLHFWTADLATGEAAVSLFDQMAAAFSLESAR